MTENTKSPRKPKDPNESVDYIIKTSTKYAQAKANRIYCEEKWKAVMGFPEYEVSNLGRIKRVKAACGATINALVNPWKTKNGYLAVGLSVNSKVKTRLVHRLVAEAWIGPVEKMDVCHNNGKRDDNRLSNLRIDTRKGNMADVYLHDTHIRGERCGSNKHSEELMRKIKEEIRAGAVVRQLAIKYNIPAPTLYGVSQGKTWAWL